MNEMVTVINCF